MSVARKSYLTIAILAAAAICSISAVSAVSQRRARVAPSARRIQRPGQVHGTVYVQLDPNSGERIFLPDISVFLKDLQTGKETGPVVSGENGRYSITVPQSGTYQLCWRGEGWLVVMPSPLPSPTDRPSFPA